MKIRATITACAAALALAGCSATPTAPDVSSPSYYGGFTFGGGNATASGDAAPCSEERGGFTFGGGNATAECPPPQ